MWPPLCAAKCARTALLPFEAQVAARIAGLQQHCPAFPLHSLRYLQCGCTPSSPSLQPVWLHGSLGREAATGRGTVFAIRELLAAQGLGEIKNKSFVIQARVEVLRWKQCSLCSAGG